MPTKTCTRCETTKEQSTWHKGPVCYRCDQASRRASEPEKTRAHSRKFAASAKRKAYMDAYWTPERRERHREILKRHYRANKAAYIAKDACRRAQKLQATPPWVDTKSLEVVYQNCPVGFEVDHIVPLRGKEVSGLHVPWNLQYLTPTENRSKGNRF